MQMLVSCPAPALVACGQYWPLNIYIKQSCICLCCRTLGALAEKCHAFAKALHYKEHEYASSPETAVEALISINNHLRQPEAAVGILTLAQQQLHMELKVSQLQPAASGLLPCRQYIHCSFELLWHSSSCTWNSRSAGCNQRPWDLYLSGNAGTVASGKTMALASAWSTGLLGLCMHTARASLTLLKPTEQDVESNHAA